MRRKGVSPIVVILFTAFFIVVFDNINFMQNVLKVFPFTWQNSGFLLSTVIFLWALIVLIFVLITTRFTLKITLIFMLFLSAITNYFMMTYSIAIDDEMIRNSMQTDLKETADLVNSKMLLYLFVLAIVPSYFIVKTKIIYASFPREILYKIVYIFTCILIIMIVLLSFSKYYTSFFREHKPLRYYTNPTYTLYSFGKYIVKTYAKKPDFKDIGLDAKMHDPHKKLMIMVLGETLRADRLSLNGYEKKTNPLLEKEDVISFSNLFSCGTSTAHSVPCMFSVYDRSNYSYLKGISTASVLDVLQHTQAVSVLWRDNNSDSKGVAQRVVYEDFRTPATNSICEGECRDIGMLVGLDDFIAKQNKDNIFIVLHQMGNHGPAYFKRYPQEFERFTPTCKSNQIENCTIEEISNTYDNTALYTDFFLSKVIAYLKSKQGMFETAMIYMSDHGESLGENGIYLHGMPYIMAPIAQKRVASMVWIGSERIKERVGFAQLQKNAHKEYSHDNLFHSILGIMGVSTVSYDSKKDIFNKDVR
ncbi:MAG: phosphoethanolamine--lipid A transferase [Sulfurospirillum sp.]|nr:phosphoethanolamine--lipid A transferase [Sulfurospirillum sp.]